MSPPLISVEEVFCLHRTPGGDVAALQGATLAVAEGELVGVVGPSGAGKSTLLRVIAGLQTPSAGRAEIAGQDIGRLRSHLRARLRNRLIGFLPQRAEDILPPDLRAEQAIGLPLAMRGVSRTERRTRAQELLEQIGLTHRADSRASALSGGERQCLALCVAIAHRPALLLADEPTAELDAESAQGVRNAIARLAASHGLTAVIVTHDPDTAAVMRRTVSIRDGRISTEGQDGAQALVVGAGGWVQLPRTLLASAGISGLAEAQAARDRIVLTRAGRRTGDPSDAARDTAAEAGAAAGLMPLVTRPDAAPRRRAAPQLELRGVSRTVGQGGGRRAILTDFSQVFPAGRLTVIQGRSGSGKTTLLRLLAALDTPDSGSVRFDGIAIGPFGPEQRAELRRDRIGYLAQDPVPVGFLTATENVELGLALRGWPAPAAAEQAVAALHNVGLGSRAHQRVARMSAGEVQRVALARALAGADGLLIIDEPTSRLDLANAGRVAELLTRAAQDGHTVVCATHDPEVIRRADVRVAF